MKAGNVRKLYVFYWRHPELDWENARTTELRNHLWYDTPLRPHMRDLDFKFLNVHRRTESYRQESNLIEQFRRYKVRREPLVYIELWQPNAEGRREEFWSIDSDYRLKLVLKHLEHTLNTD